MIWVELGILLTCILIGSRLGGMGMGAMGGLGLFVLVFFFNSPPGGPPVVVLGMILAVITSLAAMEAAGGLDLLVNVSEKILRKNPKSITFVAPFVTYFLIMVSGTQHVIYALLPVISEISRKTNIRPERPLSISVVAAMFGLIASPISAATVALVSTLSDRAVSIPQILMVIIPSTLIAVFIGALSVFKRGVELSEDPVFLERSKNNKIETTEKPSNTRPVNMKNARGSLFLFFFAVTLVVVLGIFPELRPAQEVLKDGANQIDRLDMAVSIMIIMIAISALIMLFFKASPQKTVSGSIMRSGIVAIISILGISWLGSSFFEGNKSIIIEGISTMIQGHEWVFGIGLFLLSILLFSQAATVVTLIPIAVALDMPTGLIIALYPAVNGLFFLPTYGTILAAVSFDSTGTTKIGKYLVNHSFMRPGLVTIISSVVIALLLTYIIF